MVERIMADGPSPDISPTPAQGQPEQKAGPREHIQPKGYLWRSPDFNPNADYKTKIPINPQTGKEENYISIFELDPRTGEEREMARIPKIEGGSLDVPAYLEAAKREKTRFEQLREWVETYGERNINLAALSPAQLNEYRQSRLENLQEMGNLVNGADARGVFSFVMEDIRQIYAKVAPAPETAVATRRRRRRSSMYSDYSPESAPKSVDERIRDVKDALANYQETFWDYGDAILRARFGSNANISALKEAYKGVSSYVAAKVAIAIIKDLKKQSGEDVLDPANEIGDYFLTEIQNQLEANAVETERQRQRQRRNASPEEMLGYNNWRERFEFSWAENREELERSVFAWIEKFEKHLPNETAETVHQEAGKWKANAIGALEVAAHELGISEKDPFYEFLRNTIETYTNVKGGVKLLESDGGFEPYTGYLEAHAHNFNGHHDTIYLGNAKSAIIQHFLSRNYNAISLGDTGNIEKPQAGDLEDFRGNIEEQAKEYAATQQLYIRKADFDRRETENNNGYGWDDLIEGLLLVDNRGMATANALTDPVVQAEAIAKVATRTGVFKRIKERLDQEDGLAGLTDDQRRDVIRDRIKAKIRLAHKDQLLNEINAMNQADADAALWNYVRDFNKKMESQGHRIWAPSAWDFVRLNIDTPTKLVDRVLAEDELEAMIEEVGSFQSQIGTTGLTVQINIDGLTDEQIQAQIDALPNLTAIQKRELLEDVLFDKQQRESEVERAFSINRDYQKFLGADARWGGMAVRVVDDNGNVVLKTVWQIAEEILKAKIDKEEADIEARVTAHETALRARGGLTDAQIEEAKSRRRRRLRGHATFGATLALREKGIANDLPIWNYYYYNDPQRIQTFAPLVGYTHNDKVEIVDLLDRGRREMRAVWDHLADTYMDGRVLIVRDEANADVDQNGQPRDFHQERWDRARVINEAGVVALRNVFESRFMLSTSGGIEVVDLISKIGDLGIYDLLWEMGCKNFREFQGFIKRRDEWELRRQSFWNIREWRDPITYAKRLRGAGAALPYLRGGEVKGQGRKPGVLQEPMMGAYKVRDFVLEENNWINKQRIFEVEKLIRDAVPNLKKEAQDKMVEIGAGILVTLIEYMDARRYVMNRAGLAPKNWKADNELIADAYFKELLKRDPILFEAGEILADGKVAKGGEEKEPYGAETLGSEDLGYAPQGRSELAVAFYKEILKTSTYHTLVEKDRKVWARRGKAVKARMGAERERIAAAGLPADVEARIEARRLKLVAQNTTQQNLDREIQRLKDQYFDEQLQKQFVGAWQASFADIS